ncbi:Hypothetical predicted protein [Olea europaea subsp. europaea]|uniref:Uncharacterized protein n=1 Tax=Olea europaea subsp. europaea TaxID=158383 RepID=A0A8S0VPP7_OLEEU|nr:Hypothetical predicted protein [Olea europaea subsp. europaea]
MIGMQDRLQRFYMNVNQEIGGFPTSHSPKIVISPSSLELLLGPKGNGVTKSSLLFQLDHCSIRWELVGGIDTEAFIRVVEVLSTPAVADVECKRWDS